MGAENHIASFSVSHRLAAGDAVDAGRGAASGSGPAQGHRRSAEKGRGESELEQPRLVHQLRNTWYSAWLLTCLNVSFATVAISHRHWKNETHAQLPKTAVLRMATWES